eukprot:10590421-Alexandrium_andersonii.AAC.1
MPNSPRQLAPCSGSRVWPHMRPLVALACACPARARTNTGRRNEGCGVNSPRPKCSNTHGLIANSGIEYAGAALSMPGAWPPADFRG